MLLKLSAIRTDGGTQPRWSANGNRLYYISRDGRLMSAAVNVASDGHSVEAGTPSPLFRVRPAVGGNIAVGSANARAQYAVARDGRFLMITPVDDAVSSPITLVLNWTAALQKKN